MNEHPPPHSPGQDEWRGMIAQRVATIERDLDGLQQSMDSHHKAMKGLIEQLIQRLQPLEQLRAMLIGGVIIILALSPLLWWLLTRAVYVAEKLPGK